MFGNQEGVDKKIARRREFVFIILSGVFLGTLAFLNIIGLTRQLDLTFYIGNIKIPWVIFVGVLPYPITFLCTDFISELYGRRRANMVVWVGLLLNLWVLFILWIGGILPPVPEHMEAGLPALADGTTDTEHAHYAYYYIRKLTLVGTAASMIAYLTAQFVDVQIFHMLKKMTKGKMLWLRNNGSTLTSQMVDSIAVVLISYASAGENMHVPDEKGIAVGLIILILGNYVFKLISALLDTIPFYLGTRWLSRYLQIDPNHEFRSPIDKD